MPNRIIRESSRSSRSLARVSAEAERLFWRLVTWADDYGRFDSESRIVMGSCLPLHTVKAGEVERWLLELAKVDAIRFYEHAGRRLAFFPSWDRHQRARSTKPKYPDPPAAICGELPQSAATCGDLRPEAGIEGMESREERSESRVVQNGRRPPIAANTPTVVFQVPEDWLTAIQKAPSFRGVRGFQSPAWWQAELRANHGVRFEDEIPRAQAYLLSHPERHYKNLVQFLHNWFGRADRIEAPR